MDLSLNSNLKKTPLILGLLALPLLKTELLFDYFTVIKWFAVYVLAMIAILTLFTYKKIVVPKFPILLSLCLGGAAIIFVCHMLQGHTRFISWSTADRLSIVALCFYFFLYFKQTKIDYKQILIPNLIATVVACIWGFYQIIIAKSVQDDFSSSFGNTNMTGQFLGFSILIQLFAVPWEKKKTTFHYLRLLIFFLSATYLTMLMCRSVFLGLALCLPFLFLKNTKSKAIQLSALALVAVLFGVFLRAKPAETLQRTKQFSLVNETTNQRLNMAKQSLSMIMDRPLGIGPGGYEFGYIPYAIGTEMPPREDLVYRSPHNELLRFAVEDGLPFLILMIPVILWIFLPAVKRPWTDESIFFLVFCILWSTETIFQFPFENAYPSFLFTIMTGRALSMRPDKKVSSGLVKPICAIALAALIFVSGRIMYSKYLEGTANGQAENFQVSCEAFPDHWRSCLNYANNEIVQHRFRNADAVLRDILEKSPYNFSAIQMWAILAFKTNHLMYGCEHLWIYDQIFAGTSSAHAKLNEVCKLDPKNFQFSLDRIYPKPLPKLF